MLYLAALMGSRTLDDNNDEDEEDGDAGERQTIGFFDQSAPYFN